MRYLYNIGDRSDVAKYREADSELVCAMKKYTEGRSFETWKEKVPREVLQKMESNRKPYSENTLGLLRFIRNAKNHHKMLLSQVNVMTRFPDLFGCVYMFAKNQGWNAGSSD